MVQWEQSPIRENNSSQRDTYEGNYEEQACGLIYEKHFNELQKSSINQVKNWKEGPPQSRKKDPQPAMQFKSYLAREEIHVFSKRRRTKTRFSKRFTKNLFNYQMNTTCETTWEWLNIVQPGVWYDSTLWKNSINIFSPSDSFSYSLIILYILQGPSQMLPPSLSLSELINQMRILHTPLHFDFDSKFYHIII